MTGIGVDQDSPGAAMVPHRTRVEAFAADGECLLYHPVRDEASALNRSATEVWDLCDGRLTVAGIIGALAVRYGVGEAQLVNDVAGVLKTLRARDLIQFGQVVE